MRKGHIVDHVSWWVLVIQELLDEHLNVRLAQRCEAHFDTQALLELRYCDVVDHVAAVLVMGSIVKERFYLQRNRMKVQTVAE